MALDFLRQLGASAGQARAGYRLRRCPVRLPRWACPQGWAVPRGWRTRRLDHRELVYAWADGIYVIFSLRGVCVVGYIYELREKTGNGIVSGAVFILSHFILP